MDPHEYCKSQSLGLADAETKIILNLKEQLKSIQMQNNRLRSTIDVQHSQQNDWMEKENNYIIQIKKYQAQLHILSEQLRSLDHENREISPSEASESYFNSSCSSNDNEYKTGLDSGHLEPILDEQSQEVEDVVVENFDFYDEYETLKIENRNLKQEMIELESKYEHDLLHMNGIIKKDKVLRKLQQNYNRIKIKYDAIIGLKDNSSIINSNRVIVEDIMDAYIKKNDQCRILEQENNDLTTKLADHDGLIAKWNAYKQKVALWQQQINIHVQGLTQHNQMQAQQMLVWYNHISELKRKNRSLFWSHSKQESDRLYAGSCYHKKLNIDGWVNYLDQNEIMMNSDDENIILKQIDELLYN